MEKKQNKTKQNNKKTLKLYDLKYVRHHLYEIGSGSLFN